MYTCLCRFGVHLPYSLATLSASTASTSLLSNHCRGKEGTGHAVAVADACAVLSRRVTLCLPLCSALFTLQVPSVAALTPASRLADDEFSATLSYGRVGTEDVALLAGLASEASSRANTPVME